MFFLVCNAAPRAKGNCSAGNEPHCKLSKVSLPRKYHFAFTLVDLSQPIIVAIIVIIITGGIIGGLLINVKHKRLTDTLTNLYIKAAFVTSKLALHKLFSINNKDFTSLFSEPDYNKPIKHSCAHRVAGERPLRLSRYRRLDQCKARISKSEFKFLVRYLYTFQLHFLFAILFRS